MPYHLTLAHICYLTLVLITPLLQLSPLSPQQWCLNLALSVAVALVIRLTDRIGVANALFPLGDHDEYIVINPNGLVHVPIALLR